MDRLLTVFADVSADVLTRTQSEIRTFIDAQREPLRQQLHELLEAYLHRQIHRDPPRNIALAVSYDLGITDVNELVNISLTAVYGGLHSLIIDDIVDNKTAVKRPHHHIYLAHLLFVVACEHLQRIHPTSWLSSGLDTFTASQLTTYGALVEEEVLHVGTSNPYPTPAIVWEKCAPLKAIIERVVRRVDRPNDLAPLLEAVDQACFALCTLDDMLDWEDDFAQQRLTYPIQRALDTSPATWNASRPNDLREHLFIELAFGDVYHHLMHEVLTAFEEARAKVRTISHKLDEFLDACVEATERSWREHVEFLCTELRDAS